MSKVSLSVPVPAVLPVLSAPQTHAGSASCAPERIRGAAGLRARGSAAPVLVHRRHIRRVIAARMSCRPLKQSTNPANTSAMRRNTGSCGSVRGRDEAESSVLFDAIRSTSNATHPRFAFRDSGNVVICLFPRGTNTILKYNNTEIRAKTCCQHYIELHDLVIIELVILECIQ